MVLEWRHRGECNKQWWYSMTIDDNNRHIYVCVCVPDNDIDHLTKIEMKMALVESMDDDV